MILTGCLEAFQLNYEWVLKKAGKRAGTGSWLTELKSVRHPGEDQKAKDRDGDGNEGEEHGAGSLRLMLWEVSCGEQSRGRLLLKTHGV